MRSSTSTTLQLGILALLFVIAGLLFGIYRGIAVPEEEKAAAEETVEFAVSDLLQTPAPEIAPPSERAPEPAPKPKPVRAARAAEPPQPRRAPARPPSLPEPEPPAAASPEPGPDPEPAAAAAPRAVRIDGLAQAAPRPEVSRKPAPPPEPRRVTLERGAVIPVRLAATLSSQRNLPGDIFYASLDEPLVIDGLIIADKGNQVEGRVLNVRRSGRVSGVAAMTLDLTRLYTDDGQVVEIATESYHGEGPRTRGKDARNIGFGAGLGALIGAIAGGGKGAAIGAGVGAGAGAGANAAQRGEPLVLEQEARLTFRVQQAVEIVEKL